MGLNDFDYLAKRLVTPIQYPQLKPVIYLYLLAFFVVRSGFRDKKFNVNNESYDALCSGTEKASLPGIKKHGLRCLLSLKAFDKTEGLNTIGQLPTHKSKEINRHLINRCLKILDSFLENSNILDERDVLLNDLLKREAAAVRKIEEIPSAKKLEYLSFPADKQNKKQVVISISKDISLEVRIDKLSDKGFSDLALIWILEAIHSQEYNLYPPENLNKHLVVLAHPLPGESVFNPSCGNGSLFVEFQNQFSEHKLIFKGVVNNPFVQLLCEAELLLNDINARLYFNEPLKYSSIDDLLYKEGITGNNDIVVSAVPYTLKMKRDGLNSNLSKDSNKLINTEKSFIESMLSALNSKGRAVLVVTDAFLSFSQSQAFRKQCLENDWLEKVITLPPGTFRKDALKSSILVFNKNKAEKGSVIFDGHASEFQETIVSCHEILQDENVDWSARRYALKSHRELKAILSNSEHLKRIKDLIVTEISGNNYPQGNGFVKGAEKGLPYVRLKDLTRNDQIFDLDISKIKQSVPFQKAHNIIDFSAVLINKIGTKLKPSYFNFKDQPIVIGSDIIALKLKPEENPEYFLTQLNSRLVQLQFEILSSGTAINRITKEDFLNIQVIMPSLDEQKRLIFEMQGLIQEKALVQEKITRANEQAEAAKNDVISDISHSMKNKLAPINNDFITLIKFLEKSSTIKFTEPIRKPDTNENIDDVETIKIITDRIHLNLSNASKVFEKYLELQRRESKKSTVELVDYFQNEVKRSFEGQNFKIKIKAIPNLELNVLLDKSAFNEVVENLVNNAKNHGFVDQKSRYEIVFELSKIEISLEESKAVQNNLRLSEIYDKEHESEKFDSYARIVYKNNGKPFSKDFSFGDFKKYTKSVGKTRGYGIGGWIIDRFIKLHEGKFNELPRDNSEFNVQFEILLPLDE